MTEPADFSPPFSLSEWLKFTFVPASLYARYLENKNLKKGEAELHVLPDIVPAGRLAIDVGANKGVYTRLLANLASHVHAFEPNPKAFRWLNRALPDNVTTHPIALSNSDGRADLYLPQRGKGFSNQLGSLSAMKADAPHAKLTVQTRTLDSCALSDVGFIKIDVEGFELQVLEGARRTIMHSKPVLLIELEERHTEKPIEQLIQQVMVLGYTAHFVRDGNLVGIDQFDPDRHHRVPASKSDYVFNFIFLPV